MKKLVLRMEKQKLMYEEKALVVLQKATQEKTEAISNAAMLQVRHFKLLIMSVNYYWIVMTEIFC